jgi:hypothetical protein
MSNSEQQYNELSYYTLAHQDMSFIHQHIVDAYTAQTADERTKSITITFSLAGLFLYIEKGYTGRQVQQFHMIMAKNKRAWPAFVLPAKRGEINVSHVLAISPGPGRDKMIHQWCVSVWEAFKDNRKTIEDLIKQFTNE